MCETYNDLQSSASIRLVGLQVRVQQECKVLRKDLDAGLDKQKIPNLFNSQRALRIANLSPLRAIERYSRYINIGPDTRICYCWTMAS